VYTVGHGATNYPKWQGATTPYKIQIVRGYEPYIVVHKSIPRYDERFVGRGYNKMNHIVLLAAQRSDVS